MIQDFIVSVCSSIVSSIIVGFITNKLFGKSCNDILVKIYTIFVSFTAFISTILFAYMIQSDIIQLISDMTNISIFKLYLYSSMSFVFILGEFSMVTVIFLIIRQMELVNKSIDKTRNSYLKTLK